MNIFTNKRDWTSYIRLLKYCWPYRVRLLWGVICMVLGALASITPPWLIKNVVDDVLIKGDSSLLVLLCLAVVFFYSLKGIFNYLHLYLMTWVGNKVVIDLRLELYDKTQRLPLTVIYGRRSGEFLSRITNDVATIQGILSTTVISFVVQGVTFIGILGFLFTLDWSLTLITFAIIPPTAFVIDKTSKRLRAVGKATQERLASVAAIAQEAVSSIKVVRSFVTEEQEYNRFKDESYSHFETLIESTKLKGILEGVVEIILIIALAFVLWWGGRNVILSKLTAGGLIAFLTYLGLLVQPVKTISSVIGQIQQGAASADRIFEILDEKNEVPIAANPIKLDNMKGHIEFKNVSFAYVKDANVLNNLSLEINEGEKVAIVGHTGAGKSTIADLVMRFYDPTGGEILIDGVKLEELDLKNYRKQIGVVPQDPVLMKGSLAYNIGYGIDNVTEEMLERAANIAGIYDFINELPERFNTEVGERGVTLSGGQRQRVAIARAVCRNPRILIMDEATSSLDALVEQQVQGAMNAAMVGRTSIIIAHRLSTIKNADRILVIDDGHVVESGTHDSLIALGGAYAEMYAANVFTDENENTDNKEEKTSEKEK